MPYTPSNDIQQAFLDGIEEVFSIMFTKQCLFYRLDNHSTTKNIYGEAKAKYYMEPIPLIAKVVPRAGYPEYRGTDMDNINAFSGVERTVTITIPTKQLLECKIPFFTAEDMKVFEQAVFFYDGLYFTCEVASQKTMVADIWQFIECSCVAPKNNSLLRPIGS